MRRRDVNELKMWQVADYVWFWGDYLSDVVSVAVSVRCLPENSSLGADMAGKCSMESRGSAIVATTTHLE